MLNYCGFSFFPPPPWNSLSFCPSFSFHLISDGSSFYYPLPMSRQSLQSVYCHKDGLLCVLRTTRLSACESQRAVSDGLSRLPVLARTLCEFSRSRFTTCWVPNFILAWKFGKCSLPDRGSMPTYMLGLSQQNYGTAWDSRFSRKYSKPVPPECKFRLLPRR